MGNLFKYLFFLMFLIVISCTTKTIEDRQHEIAAVDENSIIEKYTLPHKMLGENDGTTLILSREKSLDTSYLFLLRRHNGRIRAVYYDINLKYHVDVYDFLDPTNELLYFEGFSFAVDSMQWKAVINEASNITGSYNDTSGEPCLHCGRYLLSWKGKLISGDQKNYKDFVSFEKYLYKAFINANFKKRKSLDERTP